ncbi:MAG: hypothetical protein WBO10_08040 [Pyrinomonadaceae bacterium]
MLPPTTLLKNGRYRIDHLITSGISAKLYRAYDTSVRRPVAILEFDSSDGLDLEDEGRSLVHLQHDGLIRIDDDFQEGALSYCATEPLFEGVGMAISAAPPDHDSADLLFERLGSILLALSDLRSEFSTIQHVPIAPEMLLTAADGRLKLLFGSSAEAVAWPNRSYSPYLPLEGVWDTLDHINQKAIYTTYDEESLATLEEPPDARSDLYSLGAVFYRLMTGVDPMSAFERSIEMVDTGKDPLQSVSKLNLAVRAENNEFLVRMMELRRERRFGSIEDAIFSLPSIPAVEDDLKSDVAIEIDDVELLEIPAENAALVQQALLRTDPDPIPVMPAFNDRFGRGDIASDSAVAETLIVMQAEPEIPSILAQAKRATEPQPESRDREVFSGQMFEGSERSVDSDQDGGGKGKLMAIAAVAVVLLGGAVFGIRSLVSTNSAVQSEHPTASFVEAPKPQTNAMPASLDILEQEQIADSDPNSAGNSSVNVPQAEPSEEPKPISRPQIAQSSTRKQYEKRAVATPEAKPKKKLTVDDLINDN